MKQYRLSVGRLGRVCLLGLGFCLFAVQAAEERVDLLVHGALVVTMDGGRTVLRDGAVAVRGNQIVAVGPSNTLKQQFKAARQIDGSGQLLMPGLVNTHTHTPMTLLRGMADDMPLKVWLEEHIWPAEAKFMNAETVKLGAQLAMIEMIRSGTTTINDHYFFMDEVAEAGVAIGMRVVVGEALLSFPTPSQKTPADALAYTEKLAAKWKGHPTVTVAVAPHSPYVCPEEIIKQAKQVSDKWGLPYHIHLSETDWEMAEIKKRHNGLTPVGYLESLGVLGERMVAAHTVVLTEADIALLAKYGVGSSHNPESNMKLASGAAPVADLLKAGVVVGLGTDGAASNNNLDMFQEMDSAAKLQKLATKDPSALNAQQVVTMATVNGAKILGMGDKIGSLEKGKRADLMLIDLNKPHLTPIYDAYSHIVYSVGGEDVDTVIIDGKVVMEHKVFKTIDVDAVMKRAREVAAKIKAGGGK